MSPAGSSGKPGRITLSDVAAKAGVSVALVSIVIRGVPGASEETRRRVLAIAADLGYRPDQRARLLRQQRSRLIGVTFFVEHPFHGDLVDSIYRAADALKYEVALSAVTPSRSEQRAVETLLTDRCEALILVGAGLRDTALVALARQLPVVVLTRRLRRPTVDTVDAVHTADAAGLALAVDHLVSLGHRRIAHIDGGTAPGSADRRQGYRSAMKRHGLEAETRILAGGLSEDDAVAATHVLLDDSPPTAIVAFNDQQATGVLDTLLRRHIAVPEQISVVGYDNSRLARMGHINLTSIGQDTELLGRLAVERAVNRLDPDFLGSHDTVTDPQLIIRGTTGAAPTSQETTT